MRNRQFQEVTSELPLFLFIHYAVEFVLRAFKASQERYLPFGGISIHLKDFKALDSKLWNSVKEC